MESRAASPVRCRPMAAGESAAVAALVRRVFTQFVAPGCPPAGRRAFLAYARPLRLRERLERNHRILVAEVAGGLAGMIEVREDHHIAMLFVEGSLQRHGVGRALVRTAFAPPETGAATITVNATPDSVRAYERLGFRATGPEREADGLRFVPMAQPRRDIFAE